MFNLAQIEEHFFRLMDMDSENRQLYLKEIAGKNPDLATSLSELIKSAHTENSFLDKPFFGANNPLNDLWQGYDRIGSRIGPYELTETLGSGGMGVVFKAKQEDPVFREVALKILKGERNHEAFWQQFQLERQALALLDHENIARFYDAQCTEQGVPYLVMEYVDGVPINEYCQSKELSLRECIELFIQVCHGVAHAHARGVIHGDIKPQNILVQERDEGAQAKVIDFGTAKGISGAAASLLRSSKRQPIGTPSYMPPEQSLKKPHMDTRSDTYALGAVFFEILSGRPPLTFRQGQAIENLLNAIQHAKRNTLPTEKVVRIDKCFSRHIHQELRWVTEKALDLDPKNRYQTTLTLIDDQENLLHHRPVTAAPKSLIRYGKNMLAIVP